MLNAPDEEIVIESVLKKHRGVSANNPYIQPTPMTYIHKIHPPKVAEQIMQTALFLACEWLEDLEKLDAEAEGAWRSRRAQVTGSDEEIRNTMPTFENTPGEYGNATPLRGGNYDLLQALSTRQAVKAALASYSATKSGAAAHALLAKYCDENTDIFSGDIEQNAADTFVAGLLELPVTMRMGVGGGGGGDTDGGEDARAAPTIVDPRTVCEVIFEWRKAVGEAWSERLAMVPEDLLELKREHLSRSMASVD